MPPDASPDPARVILLVGPSGCGKTHLARAAGLPIVSLDDFYRSDTDPDMPRTADGRVDWEDERSWDDAAAMAALSRLCRETTVEVPDYSFGENRVTGHRTIDRNGHQVFVAEGIFAAQMIAPLEAAGLLADALFIRQNRWVTFGRRLARDLREGRKAPWYLVHQGWTKTRSEPAVVARQLRLGARPVTKAAARARLADLFGGPQAIATPRYPATAPDVGVA